MNAGSPDRSRRLSLLGLARRAGKLVDGTDACRRALRRGEGALLVLAGDAGTIREEMKKAAEEAGIPVMELADKVELGRAIGKPPKAVLVLLDEGFARAMSSDGSQIRG